MYADLAGCQINGGTIPSDLLVCGKGSKPDMVLIDRNTKKIVMLEPTYSLPKSTILAHNTKQTNYTELKLALEEKGCLISLLPSEVCSDGHITSKNNQDMNKVLQIFDVIFKT